MAPKKERKYKKINYKQKFPFPISVNMKHLLLLAG